MGANKLQFLATLQVATETCMAAEVERDPAKKAQKNRVGYAAYVALVLGQLKDGSFAGPLSAASLLPFLDQSLAAIFCNNLNALSSCVDHAVMAARDLEPVVDALQQAFEACKGSHCDGWALAAFGLARFYWEAGNRERAAELYGSGVLAGHHAAAQNFALGAFALESCARCAENLGAMRGIPLPRQGGGGGVSTKVFGYPLKKADLRCCAPGCAEDVAAEVCGGCRKARYCNRACQAKHWRAHKADCLKAQALAQQ